MPPKSASSRPGIPPFFRSRDVRTTPEIPHRRRIRSEHSVRHRSTAPRWRPPSFSAVPSEGRCRPSRPPSLPARARATPRTPRQYGKNLPFLPFAGIRACAPRAGPPSSDACRPTSHVPAARPSWPRGWRQKAQGRRAAPRPCDSTSPLRFRTLRPGPASPEDRRYRSPPRRRKFRERLPPLRQFLRRKRVPPTSSAPRPADPSENREKRRPAPQRQRPPRPAELLPPACPARSARPPADP